MNEYVAYLCFVRLMFYLKLPVEDRMSFVEFESYAKKIRNKKAS